MNLKEAIKKGKIEEFIAEHEKDAPGDEKRMKAILRRAAETPKEAPGASRPAPAGSCDDTQTRQRTLPDASAKRRRASRKSTS